MLTVNNKDTGTTLFTPCSCVSVANFEQEVPCRDGWCHKQSLSKKYFLPFNFAITKICVVILLAENGARMSGI